jgi:hypothetical protein
LQLRNLKTILPQRTRLPIILTMSEEETVTRRATSSTAEIDFGNDFGGGRGGKEDCWILIEDGQLKGMTLLTDNGTKEVVCLSTKHCSDQYRWTDMPSLEGYPSLKYVELDNCRYIAGLNESIGKLKHLERLFLTRCDSLRTLPSSIGNLENLTEVGRLSRVNVQCAWGHFWSSEPKFLWRFCRIRCFF